MTMLEIATPIVDAERAPTALVESPDRTHPNERSTAMPMMTSLGQQYHDAVEALKQTGMSNADAVRQVAKERGKKENAVRGGINQYLSRHGRAATTSRRTRGGAASVDDLLAAARRSLEQALALVDGEVEQAKTALDAAQRHYDDVVSGVSAKKTDIEKKLKALT